MRILCLTDFPVFHPDRWIWSFLPDVDDDIDFLWTSPQDRSGRYGKFLTRYPPLWRLAARALQQSRRKDYDLIVAWESKTGIPLALLRRISGETRTPFVLLTFTPGEISRAFFPVVRYALGAVDRVTVLTRGEIETYHSVFGLPLDKVELCLLGAYDLFDELATEPDTPLGPPYIHASGRSARDYATLVKAAEGLPANVIIHGKGYNFAGLTIPPNVTVGEMVARAEYQRLLAGAAVEVVPLVDTPAPVGSSQIVFAMMMGKAIVATRTGSTVDYIEDGLTGLLVKPGDPTAMRAAIVRLLRDPQESIRMGNAARFRFVEHHTFQSFARRTHDVMLAAACGNELAQARR